LKKVFVTTFRIMMQPVELLERLVLIYCTVPSDNGNMGEKTSEERKLAPIRLRILNLLKKWIQMHRYDFEELSMASLIHDFLHNTIKLTGYERVAENLMSMLQSASFPIPLACPESILPRKHSGTLELCDIDPVELARQFTLDDMIYYHSLETRDFLGCAWSKKNDPKVQEKKKIFFLLFCFV
jgi:son of sevenless-like protein